MACWRRLHLQFRHRWMSGRTSKSSNGRKIARMARNSTIFGPNESSRRDLFLENISKSRNNRKVFEKLRKIFEKVFEKFFERCNLMGDVILSNTSLGAFLVPEGVRARGKTCQGKRRAGKEPSEGSTNDVPLIQATQNPPTMATTATTTATMTTTTMP